MSQTKEEPIQYEVANKVATIWLNRPHKRNCVSPLLLEQIGVAIDRAAYARSVAFWRDHANWR